MAFIGVITMQRLIMIPILLALALPAWSAELHYKLRVDGLACPYCAYGIEKKIKALDGVVKDSVEIRLNDGVVAFEASTDRPIDEATLKTLVNDAGFTLRGVKTQPLVQEDARHEP
ncbi:MAG: heavy metal transport/detoxification protein [Cellvibrionaceae bacterium]|nr:heavy metal transport/detoxification protein [Cellvibrionaceae bacterium]